MIDISFPFLCYLFAIHCFKKLLLRLREHLKIPISFKFQDIWALMDFFFAVDFFRNTNANWRGWPRFGRSCDRVWTIFHDDSTSLDWLKFLLLATYWWPPATETSHLTPKYLTIILCSYFWKVWWKRVFPIMFIHVASNNRNILFSVSSSLCAEILSVHFDSLPSGPSCFGPYISQI